LAIDYRAAPNRGQSDVLLLRYGKPAARDTIKRIHLPEFDMGKLRHIAIAVPNTDEAATFYEQAFGLKRVRQSVSAILMSDGVISLAILDNKTSHEALGHNGLHHLGFITDDVGEASGRAESSGAVYADKAENIAKRFANRGQLQDGQLTADAQQQEQRKYVDPNGIKFDIVNNLHARNSWHLPV
jgi:catechol 2,3-dioxygenase-like lactoylglutathione lyase family enzyme